ncbi:type II secretion system protein [Kineococcus sp. G2]|uniref:type II secretion system protein n=1 Tax=Kineococcus sp. G2 TaxID=3127484 RepID=UPI00301BB604
MTAARHAGAPADEGVTLVEVLVAMLVAGVLSTVVMLTMTQAFNTTRLADGRQERAAQARVALDDTATLLRTATRYTPVPPQGSNAAPGPTVRAFSVLTPTEVVFLANLSAIGVTRADDKRPTKVRLYLDASDPADPVLREERWTSTGVGSDGSLIWPSRPNSSRAVAHRVSAPTGRIFTGYLVDDVASGPRDGQQFPESTLPVDASGAVTGAGLDAVSGVRVQVTVTPPIGETGGPATFSNYVSFVNPVGQS